MKQLLIETIRIDGGTQSRAAIDEATVAEYVEAIQAGAKMPPILCFYDGTDMWLAEGFHRFLAYQRAEKRNILAEVKNGTKEDAAWASAGANVTHGLRRTNADKRKAVEMALKLRPDMSDEAIAQHCGVSRQFVYAERRQVVNGLQPEHKSTHRTGTDGKSYPVPPSRPPTQPPTRPPAVPVQPSVDTRARCARCGHERAEHNGGALHDECTATMPSGHGCACCEFRTNSQPPLSRAPIGQRSVMPPVPFPEAQPPARRPGPQTGQVDETGHPIPDHLIPLWEGRAAINNLLTKLSEVRCAIQRAQDEGDPVFAELNTSSAMANLNTVYDMVKATSPHAVCPWCHGNLSDQCRTCKGRGMIGSFAWGRVPKDLKKGRE